MADAARCVCLLGGESSGKSTLAAHLAEALQTVWVPEYGRTLWEQRGGSLRYEDLLDIGHRQVALEDAALPNARGWLICDTSPLTTLFYCLDSYGRAEPALVQLANRRYDLCLLCAPDFAFVQDGFRRDEAFRAKQHPWFREQLLQRSLRFTVIEGPPEARLKSAITALNRAAAPNELKN